MKGMAIGGVQSWETPNFATYLLIGQVYTSPSQNWFIPLLQGCFVLQAPTPGWMRQELLADWRNDGASRPSKAVMNAVEDPS